MIGFNSSEISNFFEVLCNIFQECLLEPVLFQFKYDPDALNSCLMATLRPNSYSTAYNTEKKATLNLCNNNIFKSKACVGGTALLNLK